MQGQPRAQLTPGWVMSQRSKIGLRIIAAGICDQSVLGITRKRFKGRNLHRNFQSLRRLS